MTIETEIKEFVEQVSTYEEKDDSRKLKLRSVAELERNFAGFLNQKLLATQDNVSNGIDKEKVKQVYRKLVLVLHPDKAPQFSNELIWLDKALSRDKNNGGCVQILRTCYEQLITPEKFKNVRMNKVKTKQDFRDWLVKQRSDAKTYSGQSLFDSLLDLLDESKGFYNDVGQIKPKGIRSILHTIPYIFSCYGAFLFTGELFAIYASFYIILKGGEYLESMHTPELKEIGRAMQKISMVTAITSTVLLARILELTFWTSRQFLDASIQITSTLLKPLLPASPTSEKSSTEDHDNFCKDLILASSNLDAGIHFNTPELKAISAPLEKQLNSISQQFFSHYRLGDTKRLYIEAFLLNMRALDVSPDYTSEQKLIEAQKELNLLKKEKKVYNNTTAVAIHQAETIISLLSEPEPELEQDSNSKQLTLFKTSL